MHIICWPVAWPGPTTESTIDDVCSECGQAIWVSGSSITYLFAHPDTTTVCLPCSQKGCDPDTPVRLVAGQFAEIAAVAPDAAARIHAAAQRGLTAGEIWRAIETYRGNIRDDEPRQ